MLIIDDLLFWLPLKGIIATTEQIKKVADRELRAESKSYNELLSDLRKERSLFRKDKISQEEYETRARKILKKMSQL